MEEEEGEEEEDNLLFLPDSDSNAARDTMHLFL